MDKKQPPLIDPFEFVSDVPPNWNSKLDITLVDDDNSVKLPMKKSLWSKFLGLFTRGKKHA